MILDHHHNRLSISSYGSHMNRTFNVGSHKGSLHSIEGPNHFDLLQLTPATAVTEPAFGRRSVNIDDDAKSFDGVDVDGDVKERILILKSCYDATFWTRTRILFHFEQKILCTKHGREEEHDSSITTHRRKRASTASSTLGTASLGAGG